MSLSFQDCGIETIEYLELGGNRFAQLPDLRRLTKLQGLVLRRMKLRCVPAQICDLEERLNNIGNRRKHNVLELDGNRITSLPDTIGELVNLRRLSPRKNRLSSIPKTITKIKGIVDLRELCLSGNPFPKEALNYSSYKSIRERLKALRVLFEGASSSPKESTGKPRERTTVSTAKPKARDSSDPAMPREEVSTRYSTCCAGKWIFPPAQTESLIRISR